MSASPATPTPLRRRSLWERFRLVLFWPLVLFAWLNVEVHLSRRHELPMDVRTLSAFQNWRDTGIEWAIVTKDGQPYLVGRWAGGFSGLVMFKSGRDACVFDADGHIVAATSDDGDDPAFAEAWYGQRWPTFATGNRPPWPPPTSPPASSPAS